MSIARKKNFEEGFFNAGQVARCGFVSVNLAGHGSHYCVIKIEVDHLLTEESCQRQALS